MSLSGLYNGYYFNTNGRYESKETFMRFLDHAEKIKAFDQIVVIEEPFPGIGNVGLLESNGHQNYARWDLMQQRTPFYGEKWTEVRDGFYSTDIDFFSRSGGIFEEVKFYEEMFRRGHQ